MRSPFQFAFDCELKDLCDFFRELERHEGSTTEGDVEMVIAHIAIITSVSDAVVTTPPPTFFEFLTLTKGNVDSPSYPLHLFGITDATMLKISIHAQVLI